MALYTKRGSAGILAMTAHAMTGYRERCLQAGMDGYISKPINAEKLFQAVESLGTDAPQEPKKSWIAAPLAAAVPVTANPGVAVINEQLMRERMGDDPELLQQLIGIFCETSPALVQKIRRAVTETNAVALRDAAHALKGSVSNFAATRAYEVSGRLEVMGETAVFTGAGAACALLEEEMAALNSALLSKVVAKLVAQEVTT